MFSWFRKKEVTVCVHNWVLVDMDHIVRYDGCGPDSNDYYTVACPKCNRTKRLISYEYNRFRELFMEGKNEEA